MSFTGVDYEQLLCDEWVTDLTKRYGAYLVTIASTDAKLQGYRTLACDERL